MSGKQAKRQRRAALRQQMEEMIALEQKRRLLAMVRPMTRDVKLPSWVNDIRRSTMGSQQLVELNIETGETRPYHEGVA